MSHASIPPDEHFAMIVAAFRDHPGVTPPSGNRVRRIRIEDTGKDLRHARVQRCICRQTAPAAGGCADRRWRRATLRSRSWTRDEGVGNGRSERTGALAVTGERSAGVCCLTVSNEREEILGGASAGTSGPFGAGPRTDDHQDGGAFRHPVGDERRPQSPLLWESWRTMSGSGTSPSQAWPWPAVH